MDAPTIKLIVFALFGVIALINKVLEWKKDQDEAKGRAPSRPTPKPESENWEVELRRLLGETSPAPAVPPIPPLPPPVPTSSSRTNTPPPLAAPRPPLRPPSPPAHKIPGQTAAAHGSASVAAAAQLAQSAEAYGRASQLTGAVSKEMSEIDALTVAHPVTKPLSHTLRRPPQAEAVVALLKAPSTARQVVLASMILNPPASLTRHA